MNNVSAILAADLHLDDGQPVSRTDNFLDAILKKIKFISDLCDEYDAPLLIAGDIFHHWKPSPDLLRLAIEYMPRFIAIPGQHDLPQHNLALYHKSGLAVLEAAEKAVVLRNMDGLLYRPEEDFGPQHDDWQVVGYPFGVEPKSLRRKQSRKTVCMIHQLVSYKTKPFPGADDVKAKTLLDELTGYNLILSGDNHQSFTLFKDKKILVNPGSIPRLSAIQIKHRPRVYLWSAKTDEIETVYLPIDRNVISREHIDKEEEKDRRIDDYILRMKSDYEIDLSFQTNLKQHLAKNKVPKEIANIIWGAVEGN